MKVPEKEARKLLEELEGEESGDLMRQALRARSGAIVRKPQVPAGGPQNAMPVNPTPAAQQTQDPEALRQAAIKRVSTGWSSLIPPRAPIGPAAAQLSPPSMAAPSPQQPAMPGPGGEKPRIRVRAAGGPVPAAPLGGQAPSIEQGSPTNAPQTPTEAQQTPSKKKPVIFISTQKEYEQLEPGTEFMWPNGHIYEKPAEGG